MREQFPKRFTDQPVLLMLTILKQRRRSALRELDQRSAQPQLPHYAVGAALAEFGPLSQKEVSERVVMDPSDIVPIVDKMEQTRLVKRLRDQKDRRRYCLTLTEQGRAFMSDMDQQFAKKTDDFLAPLTAEERQTFMTLLRKLLR